MSKPENDISQIKKYLEGRLDSHAMHELERRALDDPFLADALEGYESAGHKQQKNIAELAQRLQNRTDKKVKRLIPWKQLAVAASLLIAIGIGTWLIIREKPEKGTTMAEVVKVDKQSSPSLSTPSAVIPPTNADTGNRIADNVQPASVARPRASAQMATEKSKSANESIAPSPLSGNAGAVQAESVAPPPVSEDKVAYNPPRRDSSNANELAVQEMASKKSVLKEVTVRKATQYNAETQLNSHVEGLDVQPAHKDLTGYVLAADGGQPLAGAIVKLYGSTFGVATDANGKFVIHNAPEKKSLVVGYLGYNTKQVKVSNSDSINVTLEPAGSALSEVVVTKSNDVSNTTSIAEAHPSSGWKEFADYLGRNAISPDGKTGKVKLSFMVDGKGALSGFKVIKSLSDTANQKAIDLINNGPGWAGNTDGHQQQVKLTVKFH